MQSVNSVETFDITAGEKVTYGYYAALEIVCKQFIENLESFFYDQYRLVFDFGFEIKTGIKFGRYIDQITQPAPIVIFGLKPITDQCLLVLDNRMINLFLSKQDLFHTGKISISDEFIINSSNQSSIQSSVDLLLAQFQSGWKGIHTVECNLQKLVSNRIKSKIMDSSESCIRVRIRLSQKKFQSFIEFCISAYQLERFIEKHGSKALLANPKSTQCDQEIKDYFTSLLMRNTDYELTGIVGTLKISQKELLDAFHSKKVLPITNDVESNATIAIDTKKIFSSVIGETNNHYSLQITDLYENKKKKTKQSKKPFSKLRFSA